MGDDLDTSWGEVGGSLRTGAAKGGELRGGHFRAWWGRHGGGATANDGVRSKIRVDDYV